MLQICGMPLLELYEIKAALRLRKFFPKTIEESRLRNYLKP